MIRQYHPTRISPMRFKVTQCDRVAYYGAILPGTIVRLPNHGRCMVGAWLPREYAAAKKINGQYTNTFMAGGHLALVKRLADGFVFECADHRLAACGA